MSLAEVMPAYEESSRGPDRTPPQDMAAEQCVLGAMLMSKDAIADVVEVLRGPDFYRPAHEQVYDAILDLYGRGEPADAITVSAELGKRGELVRVGGAPYLHTLLASVPVAANAGYYAEIVREKAILRRLADASLRIGQLAYAAEGDVDAIVDRAQAEVYAVTERRTAEDYKPLAELMQPTLDEMEAIESRGAGLSGVPTGFLDLDELTNGLHPGQMVILAARPGAGKSTLGLDFCRAASIKNGLTSAIFSLEMSQIEITMRLLSAEASIPLSHIRGGRMSDQDWNRVSAKMSQVSEAPMFIDDSPNLTMMEIRAKARRLKQRHDLRLVVIDYIQLMTSGKKVESRQLEVSEFSRQLKLLAKELDIPVVALSQLNRGPEQRTDKRPMLSDLRESGCLTADTRVLRADTGAEVTMQELLASGARNTPVWSLDEEHRLVARPMTHVFSSGVKEVFRLRLASGREVKASANHPFLTCDGWVPLAELVAGSRIATPRRVPAPQQVASWDDDEVVLLAHLLGDGSLVRHQPLRYASMDEANLRAVAEAARRDPSAARLDELGLFGRRSHETFVPEGIFGLPLDQVALFLRHLWATDGSVRWDAAAGQGRIYYAATSRRLVDDVARLLLRFGIVARIKTARQAGRRDGYQLHIHGVEHQRTFCAEIGAHGLRGERVGEVSPHLVGSRANTNLDTVPHEVWSRVRERVTERGMTHRHSAAALGTQFCGSTPWQHSSPERLGRVATLLEDDRLRHDAESDVSWDGVVAVESLGEQEVFDATVLGTHNFIADGVLVHNSLEQDADLVVLLSRPDLYDKESERAGEADFDVAKHRNGPTKTITVAFQGHYSRFADMQH